MQLLESNTKTTKIFEEEPVVRGFLEALEFLRDVVFFCGSYIFVRVCALRKQSNKLDLKQWGNVLNLFQCIFYIYEH